MNNQLLKIKNFWDEQAKKYGIDVLATSPDIIAFDKELKQLIKMIPEGSKILDVGCGNGVKGIELAKNIKCTYIGIDYSEEMINQAKFLNKENSDLLKGNVEFRVGNILDHDFVKEKNFDFVVTARCLINLGTIENQVIAIKNLSAVLKNGGTYLMFENSLHALRKINEVRRSFELPEIQVRWHNNYIDEEKFFPLIEDFFYLNETINYQSTYFLISRTINAVMSEGKEIDYLSKINQLAEKLPSLGDFSPAKLFLLKKII